MNNEYKIYYLGVENNENTTLFDEIKIVNKTMIIKAENAEMAKKMFEKKTGIARRNIVGIKWKNEKLNQWIWV